MPDTPLVNGNQHSWASIKAKAANKEWVGFSSIAYGDSRERAKSYGMGKHHAPRGRTSGKYTPDPLVVKMAKGTAQAFIDDLATLAPDGKSYGNVEVQFVVQFIDSGERPITVEIDRCVIVKDASSHEEGTDPLFDELTFDVMRIRRNGKTLYDSTGSSR